MTIKKLLKLYNNNFTCDRVIIDSKELRDNNKMFIYNGPIRNLTNRDNLLKLKVNNWYVEYSHLVININERKKYGLTRRK